MGRSVVETLDLNQSKIITLTDGPILVVSGPGSGKTRVITSRAAHLGKDVGIPPERLFVVTFTKAAAEEMRERIERSVGKGLAARMHIQTIHSLAYKFLTMRGQRLNVQDEREQRARIAGIVHELDLPKELVDLYLQERSNCLNRMISLEGYEPSNLQQREFQRISQHYQEQQQQVGFWDFDDLLLEMHNVLLRLPKLSGRYIMVDEFQDTSLLQYEILKRLAAPTNHFFAVGDDDQSIYGWRGASNIPLQFVKDFPEVQKVSLTVNYRSSKQVVCLSASLIENNRLRLAKTLQFREQAENGNRPRFITPKDEKDEAKQVALAVQRAHERGIPWQEMAILYRVNNQSVLVQDELIKTGIPFQMLGGESQLLSHSVTRSLVSYLEAALDPNNGEAFFHILNRPGRYINANAVAAAQSLVAKGVSPFQALLEQEMGAAGIKILEKLAFDLQHIKNLKAPAALDYVRKSVGFDQYLKDVTKLFSLDQEEYQQIANILCMLAEPEDTVENFVQRFQELSRSSCRKEDSKGVTLATCHSAKGLEFAFVIIIGMVEGLLPHRKVLEIGEVNQLEEERRLAYVAITRSKEELLVSSSKTLQGKLTPPSRFVRELKNGLPAIKIDGRQTFKHPLWGSCILLSSEKNVALVKKPNGEEVRVLMDWLEEKGLA